MTKNLVLVGLAVSLLAGCPGPDCGASGQACCTSGDACEAGLTCTVGSVYTCQEVDPVFPENYRDTFTEVRDCRTSIDHDLVSVRIWANDVGRQPYLDRTDALPDGSLFVKEEYEDRACTNLIGWTVMRREAEGYEEVDGWHFQSLGADRAVILDGSDAECVTCHLDPDGCGGTGLGFDGTCAEP